MQIPHPIPTTVGRRWELATQGYCNDVASSDSRRGAVALSDAVIDGPAEGLWGLLMGRWSPSAPNTGPMNHLGEAWHRTLASDLP
jgi:hypothetical protein